MPTTKSVMPQHLIIAALLANPIYSHADIAEQVGVCKATVDKVSQKLKAAVGKSDIELESYKMLIRERVPVDCRVGTLRKAIDKADSNPFAALKAVEYADSMLGLAPKQQQTEQISESRPMFVLPAGTSISVSISTPQDAIDVTPLDTDNE